MILLAVGHIQEVKYLEWLDNVVLMPKLPTFCMCVDYMDLNKVFLMGQFPLPSPDQMVDETSGCELFKFMDAFKVYHQIFKALEN